MRSKTTLTASAYSVVRFPIIARHRSQRRAARMVQTQLELLLASLRLCGITPERRSRGGARTRVAHRLLTPESLNSDRRSDSPASQTKIQNLFECDRESGPPHFCSRGFRGAGMRLPWGFYAVSDGAATGLLCGFYGSLVWVIWECRYAGCILGVVPL